MKVRVTTFALAAALTVASAIALAQKKSARPAQSVPVKKLPKKELDLSALFNDLGRVDGGPGIIIFEPVSSGLDDETARFAAGCSRWLQFVVGGHGELGKTPAWDSIGQVQHELGLADLRTGPEIAARFGKLLGVTHVATARASGSTDQLTIEYELRPLNGGPIAAATVSGDRSAIVRDLPGVAAKLARALGVPQPRIAETCAAGPEGLQLMGSVSWSLNLANLGAVRKLAALVARDPAAMPLLIGSGFGVDPDTFATLRGSVERLAKENTIALHLLSSAAGSDPRYPRLNFANMIDRFPNNYLLNLSMIGQSGIAGQPKDAIRYARMAARISPGSSRAWSVLGNAYSDLAGGMRRGRVIADMTKDELDSFMGLYAYWTAAAKRAVELDPLFARGWLDLSEAACFLGVAETADEAFWKSVKLEPNDFSVLWWGLEMYQPKWLDNRARLDKVVSLCQTAKYPSPEIALGVVKHIGDIDTRYKPDWQKLAARIESECREKLKSNPADGPSHMALGRLAEWSKNDSEALEHYLEVARTSPNNEPNLIRVSELAHGKPQAAEAINLLQQAVERRPGNLELLFALGNALSAERRYPESIRVYDEMIRISPRHPDAHVMRIQALMNSPDIDGALKACLDAGKALPGDRNIAMLKAQLLQQKGDRPAAIQELRLLLATEQQKSNRPTIAIQLAQALMYENEKDEALKVYRTIIEDDPNSSLAGVARDILIRNGKTIPDQQPGGVAGGRKQPTTARSTSKPAGASSDKFVHAQQLKEQGRFEDALTEFRDVLRLSPNHPHVHLEIAMCLMHTGKSADADSELRKAIAQSPDDAESNYWMGLSIASMQKPLDAIPFIRRSTELAPRNIDWRRNYVDLLLSSKRTDEAISAARAATAAFAGDPSIRECLARAFEQKGDNESALREYRQCIADCKFPAFEPLLRLGMGKLLWKMSKEDEARAELQKVMDNDKDNNGLGKEAKRLLESWK